MSSSSRFPLTPKPARPKGPLARFTCGGTLSIKYLRAFLRAIDKQEAGEKPHTRGVEELDLMVIADNHEALRLFSRKVNNAGQVIHLEKFCREHDLTYRRVTSGGGVIQPTEAFWKPGMEIAHEFQINQQTGDLLYPMTFLLSLRARKVDLNEWVLEFKRNFPTAVPPLEIAES